MILMLLICISIHTEFQINVLPATVWTKFVSPSGGSWTMTTCRTQCTSQITASICWKYCWKSFTLVVCPSVCVNKWVCGHLLPSIDFHDIYSENAAFMTKLQLWIEWNYSSNLRQQLDWNSADKLIKVWAPGGIAGCLSRSGAPVTKSLDPFVVYNVGAKTNQDSFFEGPLRAIFTRHSDQSELWAPIESINKPELLNWYTSCLSFMIHVMMTSTEISKVLKLDFSWLYLDSHSLFLSHLFWTWFHLFY